jgi:hypothetical protein
MAGSTDPTDQCKALGAMIATGAFWRPPDTPARGIWRLPRARETLTDSSWPSPPRRDNPRVVDDDPSRTHHAPSSIHLGCAQRHPW